MGAAYLKQRKTLECGTLIYLEGRQRRDLTERWEEGNSCYTVAKYLVKVLPAVT